MITESARTSFSSLPPICSAAMVSFWYSCGEVPAAIEASLTLAAAFAAEVAIARNAAGTLPSAATDLSTVALTSPMTPPTPVPNSRTLPKLPANARADLLDGQTDARADVDGRDQTLLRALNNAAEGRKPAAALACDPAHTRHALAEFLDRRAGRLGGGCQCGDRGGQIDPLAGLLQLGEGVLAGLAEVGQRALDLLATLQRDALRDGRTGHGQSSLKCLR